MSKKQIDVEKMIKDATTEFVPLTKDQLPIKPLFYSIIVEPLPPKQQSEGGLIIAQQAQEVEAIQNTVGIVLAIGSLAFKSKTAGGLDLEREEIKIAEGDYVIFQRYTGQKVKLKPSSGSEDRTVIILSDTELMGVVSDPDKIRFWL
jgi:co-chaperonin GroES (HSP10)